MAQIAPVIKVKKSPKALKGSGGELIARVPVTRKNAFGFADTTAINLFELPGRVLVTNVDIRVVEAFEASGTSAAATMTLTIPNDTGVEVLFDSALTLLQSSGFKPATTKGVTPDSGGMVIANFAPGTTTTGQVEVYISYIQFEDKL